MTDADYVAAFQKVVMPIAYEFRPDFVLGKSDYLRPWRCMLIISFIKYPRASMPLKAISWVAAMFRQVAMLR